MQGLEMARANKLAEMQQMQAQRKAEMEETRFAEDLATSKAQRGKTELEQRRAGFQLIADLASSATDEPSYQAALTRMGELGVDTSKLPSAYDPKFVETQGRLALTEAQRLDAELRRGTADVQRGQLRLAERKQAFEERKPVGGAGEAGTVKPPSLQKGERWNPDAQRVEAVEGSDIYIKQSGKHNKDFTAINAINNQRDLAIGKLDKLLSPENTDAFSNLFGGYGAYVTRELSGKTANLRSDLESLKNNLKAAGKKIIAGAGPGAIGQITEREWPILEGMIAELRPTMTEEGAREKLQEIKIFMDNLAAQAGEEYETTWGRTQFFKQPKGRPAAAPATRDVMSEADAILGL
jgi:hypothetical protein